MGFALLMLHARFSICRKEQHNFCPPSHKGRWGKEHCLCFGKDRCGRCGARRR